MKADGANAYSYSPFHGTPLRKMAEDAGFIEKGLIARSITCPTVLDMPQYPKEQIEGMRRCFNLYVGLPKKRWGEIHEAEKLTVEGDRIWRNLRDEASSNNAKLEWKNNSTVPLEELAMGA